MYTFPYLIRTIEEGTIPYPRITLNAHTKVGTIGVKFLVDSGADITSLPINQYGNLFGIKRDPANKTTIGGIEGQGIDAYPAVITIQLGTLTFPLRCVFLETAVTPLLGRLDIWDKFSITFDNKKKQTVLTPIT